SMAVVPPAVMMGLSIAPMGEASAAVAWRTDRAAATFSLIFLLPSCGTRQCRLTLEQRALSLHPPAVSGKRAVATYHPVAGHRQRQGVGRTGPCHGAHRPGRTDTSRQLGIA